MILRLTYLASAFALAAADSKAEKGAPAPDASKAGKSTPAPTFPDSLSYSMSMPTPSPSGSKSSKGNTPNSKSGKGKTSDEYFIAPFSCPGSCISAEPYEPSSHLLVDGAVTECDASDSYQKWKVHQVGSMLKFESAAQYDQGMCLAVVHQDPDHSSNGVGLVYPIGDAAQESGFELSGGLNPFMGATIIYTSGTTGKPKGIMRAAEGSGRRNLLSEEDVEGMCTGKLGLAHCDHPGSYWYNTGGQLLSALCWDQGTSAAMSVEGCNDLAAVNTTITGDLTTSETFMLLGSN